MSIIPRPRIKMVLLAFFFGALCIIAVSVLTARFTLHGVNEGLYLLKGPPGRLFELKDIILLGDYERLIFKIEFDTPFSRTKKENSPGRTVPEFHYTWDGQQGEGYIKSFFPDGTRLILSFSRFVDSLGSTPRGLFVGGGLPYHEHESSEISMNETGMAFFDGRAWRHLWCNANESINSSLRPGTAIYPGTWKFLGSSVLFSNKRKLIIRSRHEVVLDGIPVRIDRFALYRAGDKYFILSLKIKNVGMQPVGYSYIYGDEPWVGNFGSSRGNVGWVRDRLLFYEGAVDPVKYSYAGMFDFGNKMIPQGQGEFTGSANFIEWLENTRPDLVYFSNKIGVFADEREKVPLASEFNRVIMLQWGPRLLDPGQADVFILAIGMADRDPVTDVPIKPTVKLNLDELSFLLTN